MTSLYWFGFFVIGSPVGAGAFKAYWAINSNIVLSHGRP